MTPPIPARLAGRPTVGGLVVPYISIHHADGYVLGAVHNSRRDECVYDTLCQIDGEPLGARIVLHTRPKDHEAGYTAEPGMHPECAAYSALACPMTNGSMSHYRRKPHSLAGLSCDEPGCECGGWVEAADNQHRAGAPAEPWSAVWIRHADYRIAVGPDRTILGVALTGFTPLRVRPIARTEAAA